MSGDANWDPRQYSLFGDHRGRPFEDLLARLPPTAPARVVDLGCGPGDQTLRLAERWPDAHIVGIDSSPQMLERARAQDTAGRVEWVQASAEEWDPRGGSDSIDVLVTNATLQWVPTHMRIIPRWLEALTPGGVFAMQVPANFDAPAHRIMRQVAAGHPRAADLRPGLDRARTVALPATYAALLLGLTGQVDVWQTTYEQVLAAEPGKPHPVLEWMRGTGLRPVLGVLTERDELSAFLTDYEERLEEAYPRRSFGVLFPFTRIFAVAQRRGDS